MTSRDLAERFTAGERVRVCREPAAYARVAAPPDLCDERRGLDLIAMLALGAAAIQDDARAGRLVREGVDEPALAARASNEWLRLLVAHGCEGIVIRKRERAVKSCAGSRTRPEQPVSRWFHASSSDWIGAGVITSLRRKVWFERGV